MSATEDYKKIQQILSGDKEAYASFVRLYQVRIIQFCTLLLSNAVDAEDAAQEIFVKAYQSLPTFKGGSSFYTWICRIAHNHCMDKLRAASRKKTESWDDLYEKSGDQIHHQIKTSSASSQNPTQNNFVFEALESMSSDYREILVLREIQGLTYDEIASTLRCSLDAVKAKLQRARKELTEKARHFLKDSNV